MHPFISFLFWAASEVVSKFCCQMWILGWTTSKSEQFLKSCSQNIHIHQLAEQLKSSVQLITTYKTTLQVFKSKNISFGSTRWWQLHLHSHMVTGSINIIQYFQYFIQREALSHSIMHREGGQCNMIPPWFPLVQCSRVYAYTQYTDTKQANINGWQIKESPLPLQASFGFPWRQSLIRACRLQEDRSQGEIDIL